MGSRLSGPSRVVSSCSDFADPRRKPGSAPTYQQVVDFCVQGVYVSTVPEGVGSTSIEMVVRSYRRERLLLETCTDAWLETAFPQSQAGAR